MTSIFDSAIDAYRTMGIDITVEVLGMRPCMGEIDKVRQAELEERLKAIHLEYLGREPKFRPGSTDCNIPFSMGIAGLSTGCYTGAGAHTREEWVDIESLNNGILIAGAFVLDHFRKNNPQLFE